MASQCKLCALQKATSNLSKRPVSKSITYANIFAGYAAVNGFDWNELSRLRREKPGSAASAPWTLALRVPFPQGSLPQIHTRMYVY